MQKFKFNYHLLSLVLLYLLITIPVLFTFQGTLGGDESYQSKLLFSFLVKNDGPGFISALNEIAPYHQGSRLIQMLFSWPYELLFPTNELSVFLGDLTSGLFVLIFTYIIIGKILDKKTALLTCVLFVISPIGFTISTICEDGPSLNIILLSFLLFLYFHFHNNKTRKYISIIIMMFLPLVSPYFFILWPCTIVELAYSYKFGINQQAGEYLKYIKYFIIGFATSFYFNYKIFLAAKERILWDANIVFESFKIKRYVNYCVQLFSPNNISGLEQTTFLINLSLIIFLILLISSIIYMFGTYYRKHDKRHKLLPLLVLLFLVTTIIIDFYFNKKLYNIDHLDKNLVIRIQDLRFIAYLSFILIAYFISNYKQKILKVFLFIYLSINLYVNLTAMVPIGVNNNFVNYDLGTGPQPARHLIDTSSKTVEKSIEYGFASREVELSLLKDIDHVILGYGMHLYYNNDEGINYCNMLHDPKKVSLCKKGYSFSREEFDRYVLNKYNTY